MELRELIEQGAKKAGEQKALASFIGIEPRHLTEAKSGRRGLPDFACIRLANYIGIEPIKVIAASALVTERNEDRRKVFYPFVMGRAAMLFVSSVLIGTTALPTESQAAQRPMTTASGIIGIMSTTFDSAVSLQRLGRS